MDASRERYAILDVESTTYLNGSPLSARNRLCYVGIRIAGRNHLFDIEYSGQPYNDALGEINVLLDSVDSIVGFNLKFDLGWLRRYGVRVPADGVDVFDLQLCEFLESNQSIPYPSLANTLIKYGLPPKSDIVEREYWSVGINTPQVPRQVLETYLSNDLEIEDALYDTHRSICSKWGVHRRNLLSVQNQDLLVLLEMEHNGIRFDFGAMERESQDVERQLEEIEAQLVEYNDGWPHFNWDSGDHLSCLLYGGTISVDVATPYEHVIKTGPKAGQTVSRNRWETTSKTYPGLCKPIKGSELKKEGYWSVEESVLRQLVGKKKLIDLLLKRSELEKYLSTYLIGIPKHLEKYDWQDGHVHGTFNQCRAITGRLSSEKPNQQNFPESLSKFIVSRY